MAEDFYIDSGKKIKLRPTGRGIGFTSNPVLPNNIRMALPPNFITPFSAPQEEDLYTEFTDPEGFRLAMTEEFIVRFDDTPSDNDFNDLLNDPDLNISKETGYRRLNRSIPIYLMRQKDYAQAKNKINSFHDRPGVANAIPNFRFRMSKFDLPSTVEFDKQWVGDNNYGQLINLFDAWNITKGSPDITVAIIDDGIDHGHLEFRTADKFLNNYNAIDDSDRITVMWSEAHGTSCAGIISADYSPDSGICGIAPGCRLMAVKVADVRGDEWTDTATLIKAVDYVSDKADVVNCSWGSPEFSDLREAIRKASADGRSNNKGCIFCVSSGNFFGSLDNRYTRFPGSMDEVITVSACNSSGMWEYFPNGWGSCSGPNKEVDNCAPGYHIVTTDLSGNDGMGDGNYRYEFWGTSAAAPHVTGVAALMLSVNPDLSSRQVKEILAATATKSSNFGNREYDELEGYGVVNAGEAVRLAQSTVPD